MSLRVEVAGFGICRTATPFSTFIVSVHQERFEAWTVYRRYESFVLLREQLRSIFPEILELPFLEANDFDLNRLEECRIELHKWLHKVTSENYILRMQFMYHFLCLDANLPPPFLESHVTVSSSGSFDEMEMEEMFDEDEQEEEEENEERNMSESDNDSDYDENSDNEECNEDKQSSRANDNTTVFMMDECRQSETRVNNPQGRSKVRQEGRPPSGKHLRGNLKHVETAEDREEGMDIKSLSYVEAEFIYDKADDTVPEAETEARPKKKISLEAFKIMKVIGKGKTSVLKNKLTLLIAILIPRKLWESVFS